MKTEIEEVKDEKNTVILKVEVPAKDLTGSINKAYKEVSRKVSIPGFRKGKVPPNVINQMVGKEKVLTEALNELIPELYPKALEMSGVEPVSPPQINIEQMDTDKPLKFTAKVQVFPEIELGDYQEIEMEEISTKATAEDVKKQIEKMRNKFAGLEPVKNRALKEGDYALIDFEGFLKGKPFEGGAATDYMLEIGSETLIPGFEEQLIGAKSGEERDINVTFPKDYQSDMLAGQEAVFTVKIREIKKKKLPKLDDEFAKSVSKHDSLAELKKDLQKELSEAKKQEAEQKRRNHVLDYVAEKAKIDIPPAMIDRQINNFVQDFDNRLKRENQDLKSYLEKTGDKIENFRQTFRADAIKQVKTNLVLEAIAKAEDINISDERAEEEIKKLAGNSGKEIEEFKKELTAEHISYLKDRLRLMDTIAFLESKIKTIKKKDD